MIVVRWRPKGCQSFTTNKHPMTKEKDINQFNEPEGQEYRRVLSFEEIRILFQETDKQIKETGRYIRETERQIKKTDDKVNKIYGLYSCQWGNLVESLVSGCLVRILNGHGIMVRDAYTKREGSYGDIRYEFDMIAGNGQEIVVTEVKSTLRPADVEKFLYRLRHVRTWIEGYRNKTVYGAVAYLSVRDKADQLAMEQGLLVIKATGDSASIVNPKSFQPQTF